MRPDGTEKHNITANSLIPKGFIGQPAWHPDGEHLVIQAENHHAEHRLLNHMAWGINNDLWLIRRDGAGAQRIWSTPPNHAALHPHFNADGTKIIFSERVPTGESRPWIERLKLGAGGENHWDGWRIHTADFDITQPGEKMLSNHQAIQPNGGGFYETHGFSDDQRLIYSYTPDGLAYVDDIYRCDPSGGNPTALVNSSATWDEHGIFSPSGDSLAFISSRSDQNWRAPRSGAITLRTELYLIRAGEVIQLTDFNQGGKSKTRYLVSDYDWKAAGTGIIYQVVPQKGNRANAPELWMITFSRPQ